MLKIWLIRLLAILLLACATVTAVFVDSHQFKAYIRWSMAILIANGILTAGGLLRRTYREEQIRTVRSTRLITILWVLIGIACLVALVAYFGGG